MQTRLSEEEIEKQKQQLKEDAIAIRIARSQGDGSALMLLVGRNDPKGPLRISDVEFRGTGLEDFFEMQQIVEGKPRGENGIFIKYVQEVISQKIEKGEITDLDEAKKEINKLYVEFSEDLKAQANGKTGPATRPIVVAKATDLEHKIAVIQEERRREHEVLQEKRRIESEQLNSSVNSLKSAVEEVKKTNNSFITPTGIKSMMAAIKKFNSLSNPTDKDKVNFINTMKNIADTRLHAPNNSRAGLLQDFYAKVVKFDITRDNHISSAHIRASKFVSNSLTRISQIFKHNSGSKSTLGKIEKMLSKHIPAMEKLDNIKIALEQRIETSKTDPSQKLNNEHKNLYKALLHYIDDVKKGIAPDLNKPKYVALLDKSNQARVKAIEDALGMEATKKIENVKPEKPEQQEISTPKSVR